MDLRWEIYIPVEAEVKNIPLWSLPNSVVRRMGLPLSDSHGSKKLTNSPRGIWICPAVIRRKDQKPASHTGNSMVENMFSLLGREFRSASGPFRMSFVFSNSKAHKVLKDTVPGNKASAHLPHTTSLLPQGSAPRTYQTGVVIYAGRIYLSIRKPSRSQGQRETHEPQPTSRSAVPSTSHLSSKGQKKELLNDNKPKKKRSRCKVTRCENKKGVAHKVRDVSSSKTAHVPQSTDSVHKVDSQCHKDARGEQIPEEAAVQEPGWFQPQGEQEEVANYDGGECEMQDLGSEEAESTNQNNDRDSNAQISSGKIDQSSTESWNRAEPLGAACASTSIQNDFDFNELAADEKLTQMKAKLRQKDAAVNFPS